MIARTPIAAPINVGRTNPCCPVTLTIKPRPNSVKTIWTKTPSVMSTRTLAAAVGIGAPCSAASRALTTSPPTVAEGTSVLTDSPIQRIQNSCHSGQSLGFRKERPPRNRIQEHRDNEVINRHYCNPPTGGSKCGNNVWRPLPNQQQRK